MCPALLLRCSAATSRALRVAPPLPRGSCRSCTVNSNASLRGESRCCLSSSSETETHNAITLKAFGVYRTGIPSLATTAGREDQPRTCCTHANSFFFVHFLDWHTALSHAQFNLFFFFFFRKWRLNGILLLFYSGLFNFELQDCLKTLLISCLLHWLVKLSSHDTQSKKGHWSSIKFCTGDVCQKLNWADNSR